ncbi:MAG TPA: hypothetical protein VL688_05040, partial [Verrucomicrobiae bacterium]|nr:hypothetical protein [Verrucomicrobiae bacterium]
MRMSEAVKKGTGLLTALIFCLTGLLPSPPIAAAAENGNETEVSRPFTREILNSTSLPAELGSIEESYKGTSPFLVFVVRDAHANYHAQASIENLIGFLVQKYGLKDVALEGGAGEMDPTLFRYFPDEAVKREIFDAYLKKGELSGAVSAAVFSQPQLRFHGLEDTELYRGEIRAFLKAAARKPEALQEIEKRRAELQARKKEHYAPALLELDARLVALDKDPSKLAETFLYLCGLRDPKDYPALQVLFNELEHSRESDQGAAARALQTLAADLSRRLQTSKQIKEFSEQKQEYDTGSASPMQFAAFLTEFARENGWAVEVPPEVETIARNHLLFRKMKGMLFSDELESFVRAIQESLLDSPAGREIFAADRALVLARKLASLEITPSDWEEIKSAGTVLPLPDAVHFYEISEKRDSVFFNNLIGLLENRGEPESKPVMFVAGGFHTPPMLKKLQEKHISYTVISPAIEEVEEGADEHYLALMKGDVSWKNHFKHTAGGIDLYESFSEDAVEKLLEASAASGPALKAWRDELIRGLAGENRLSSAGDYTRFMDAARRRELGQGDQAFLRSQWKEKIENFARGLSELVSKGQLTDANLARLFSPAAASPIADKPLFPSWVIPNDLMDLMLGREVETAAPKSELRSDQEGGQPEVVTPETVVPPATEAAAPPAAIPLPADAVSLVLHQLLNAWNFSRRPEKNQDFQKMEARVAELSQHEQDPEKKAERDRLRHQLEVFYRPLLADNVNLPVLLGHIFADVRTADRLSLALTPFAHLEKPQMQALALPPGAGTWENFPLAKTDRDALDRILQRLQAFYASVPFADGFIAPPQAKAGAELAPPEYAEFEILQNNRTGIRPGDLKLTGGLQMQLEEIWMNLFARRLITPPELALLSYIEVRAGAPAAAAYDAGTWPEAAKADAPLAPKDRPRLVLNREMMELASTDPGLRRILTREIEAVLEQVRIRGLLAHESVGLPVLFDDLTNDYQARGAAMLKLVSLRHRLRQFLESDDRSMEISWAKAQGDANASWARILEIGDKRIQSGETVEVVLDALTTAAEAGDGSLTAFLMQRSPGVLATGFAALGDRKELLWRLKHLETEALNSHLDQQAAQFRRYGTYGAPNGEFWPLASRALHRRLITDLTARVTEQRKKTVREELYGKKKEIAPPEEAELELKRQLDFELAPHQLLKQDLRSESVYPDSTFRLNGLVTYYERLLEERAASPAPAAAPLPTTPAPAAAAAEEDDSTLINFILKEAGFPEVDRMRIWPKKSPETKKVEKLVQLLDFLTRSEWMGSNMVFRRFEDAKSVYDLLGDEKNYFRSEWIRLNLENQYFSRLGVFKELGFTTGGVFGGRRENFYPFLELASVVLALIRSQEFRGLMGAASFDPVNWNKPDKIAATVELAKRILQDPRVRTAAAAAPAVAEPEAEAPEGEVAEEAAAEAQEPQDTDEQLSFREKYGIILGRDLTRRVYSNLFLRNIRQSYYWQNLMKKAIDRSEEILLDEAVREDVAKLQEDEKHFTDAAGHRVLTLQLNSKKKITGVLIYKTDEAGQILYADKRDLLNTGTTYEDGKSLDEWLALQGNLFGVEVTERLFYENGLPALRVTLGAKLPKKTVRNVKGVQTYKVEGGQIVSVLDHALHQDKIAFEPGWTLTQWRDHMADVTDDTPAAEPKTEMDIFGYDRKTNSTWDIYFTNATMGQVMVGKKPQDVVTDGTIHKIVFTTAAEDLTTTREDEFELLKQAEAFFREEHKDLSPPAMRSYWEGQKGKLYGEVKSRSFNRIVKNVPYTDLKVNIDTKTGDVVNVEIFFYSDKNKMVTSEVWVPISPFTFPTGFSFDDWRERLTALLRRQSRSFYDSKERKRLEVNFDALGNLTGIEHAAKIGARAVRVFYLGDSLTRMGVFDGALSLQDWEKMLEDYEPLFAVDGDETELKAQLQAVHEQLKAHPAVSALLKEHETRYFERMNFGRLHEKFEPIRAWAEAQRQALAKARQHYENYLGERKISGKEDNFEIKQFVESVVVPGLAGLVGEWDSTVDLDVLLARVFAFAVQTEPRSLLGLSGPEQTAVDSGIGIFTQMIPENEVTATDADAAAKAILEARKTKAELRSEVQPAPRAELRSLQDKIRQGLNLHDKMEPVRQSLTRALALMDVNVRKYNAVDARDTRPGLEGKFLDAAHGNANTAMHSALWAVEYLHETNGEIESALDDSPLSLLYAAYQSKGDLPKPKKITDVQPNELLARLVRGGDPAHWNHDVVEQTLTSIAAVPENRRRQDLITSFFTLN